MIYFISDKGELSEEAWQKCMKQRMKEGVEYIIIRDRGQFSPLRAKQLMDYKKMHPEIKTKIIIHSDVKLAQEIDADGVHLPYALWEEYKKQGTFKEWKQDKVIGISIHNIKEAQTAEDQVDYMFLSPVFHPSCKVVEGKGISWFKQIKKQISTPIVALGGITPKRIKALYKAGIEDIAVMSYLMDISNSLQILRGEEI